ncbi:hypothetical protein SP069_00210 [Salmonella phage SP069]|uniref:Uncharacterized protein n=2 Tax=Nonanavirus TaxID=1921122 RepID=S4TRK2_9CAUD|nr:hypothetical protein QII00_sAgp42 [Salmonella phage SP069]AGF89322.1 hypothetical protein SP062_00210 [Salmonella phage FSL SP-062]AGF89541.1 hypothetical protein SP069_00210 [Salmonella phage SP069]ECL8515646.1 hypothetical protein [Salmonella enterica]
MRNSYDPSLKYVFTRPMLWNGKEVSAGDKVSTSKATPAVLNALVRMRHIEPAGKAAPVMVADEPVMVANEPVTTTMAEIKRDAPKTYNVYVMGMPMNSEPFGSKSMAAEWCDSQGLTYNYS